VSGVNPRAKEIMARLNKKMGAGTVVPGASVITYDKIPSGSLGLDVILGGGWAANQWHEIIGEFSSGKTNLALATIAANQRRDPEYTTVWVASESFEPNYARMCGVDTDRLLVVNTHIMEEAYQATLEFAESQAIDSIVIDSLPMLVPGSEDEKDMEQATVGRGALLTGKFFRKVGKATRRSLTEVERPVTGFVINQYRMKIGVMHGDPRTTPGGEGKNYAFHSRVEVKRDEWIEAGVGNAKARIGQTVRAKTIKNKSAPQQQEARYDIYFDHGGPVDPGQIDYSKEVGNLAILFGLIDRAGAWYSYGKEGDPLYHRWQGKDNIFPSIRQEVDLMAAIEADVLRIARGA
jgi:recombination protein RecA